MTPDFIRGIPAYRGLNVVSEEVSTKIEVEALLVHSPPIGGEGNHQSEEVKLLEPLVVPVGVVRGERVQETVTGDITCTRTELRLKTQILTPLIPGDMVQGPELHYAFLLQSEMAGVSMVRTHTARRGSCKI